MRLEFSEPLSRKRLAFSIQALEVVPKTPNASYGVEFASGSAPPCSAATLLIPDFVNFDKPS
jgi:hypothetical protein